MSQSTVALRAMGFGIFHWSPRCLSLEHVGQRPATAGRGNVYVAVPCSRIRNAHHVSGSGTIEINLLANQRPVTFISTCWPLKDSACASLIALDNWPVEYLSQLCLKLSNRMQRQALQQASQQAPDARPYYNAQSVPLFRLAGAIYILATASPALWFGFSRRQPLAHSSRVTLQPLELEPRDPAIHIFQCIQGLSSQRSSSPQVFSAPSSVPRPGLEITLAQKQ